MNHLLSKFKNPKAIFALMLLFSVCVCFLIDRQFRQSALLQQTDQFEKICADIELAFDQYLHPLQGIAAALAYNDYKVSAKSFRKAALQRGLYANFPGALGFGLIRRIPAHELATFLNHARKDNKKFSLRRLNAFNSDAGEQSDPLLIIEMVEPIERNAKAVGLVISDEKNRREAALDAIKTGAPTITKTIQLVQAERKEPGFLYYLPFYRTLRPLISEKEREQSLLGLAYAPLLASEIAQFVMKQNPNSIPFAFFEINESGSSLQLFNNQLSQPDLENPSFQKIITIGMQKWRIVGKHRSNLMDIFHSTTIIVFLISLFLSLMVYFYFATTKKEMEFQSILLSKTKEAVDIATKALNLERVKTAQAAKLASLGEMSAGIAHEINNPLAIIVGTIPLIDKSKDDPKKLSQKIISLEKSAARIEKIVKGLNRFSRSTEGQSFKVASLNNIIMEALTIVEPKLKRNFVRLELDVMPELNLNCDSVEIEQVIVNLINNAADAIKSTPNPWIQVNGFSNGDQIVLQVIDSGTGISPEIEEKLFDPFFTTKPIGEGTGLGLSISKGILDSHKASIELNRSMKNTCFEIRFPAAASAT